MTAEQKTKIKAMRQNLCSYSEIAEALGLPLNSVKSYCLRNQLNTEAIKKNTRPCKNCGKPIASHSKTKPRLFCCNECKVTWWKKQKTSRDSAFVKEHICPTCGKPFFDYESAGRKYCSIPCYQRRNRNG